MSVEWVKCERCENNFALFDEQVFTECAVCRKLGNRSLVWLLNAVKGKSAEEIKVIMELFNDAKGSSSVVPTDWYGDRLG